MIQLLTLFYIYGYLSFSQALWELEISRWKTKKKTMPGYEERVKMEDGMVEETTSYRLVTVYSGASWWHIHDSTLRVHHREVATK